ncbi:hypothetical protein M2302_006220 [Micromonospora sp. A200]|uniref:hypothetical protein n=1 Tax=Micromonospora sp. A200 TaxID=2940568 RepID=UPI0024765018|nr:hypothetical protein [Micromonospora sp. A200]MDH6466014.1 hypothetical protein [Micromonospora sp. A200]
MDDPADLLLAQLRPSSTPDRGVVRSLSLLPYRKSWRVQPGRPTFSEADVAAYLANPPFGWIAPSAGSHGMSDRTYSGLFIAEGSSDQPLAEHIELLFYEGGSTSTAANCCRGATGPARSAASTAGIDS